MLTEIRYLYFKDHTFDATVDDNKSGTKDLKKEIWYYSQNVIKINDIGDNETTEDEEETKDLENVITLNENSIVNNVCLLYTSDAADE